MASVQSHYAADLSGNIYHKIMSMRATSRQGSPGRRTISSARSSATQFSINFSASRSKFQQTYSDNDIIRNKSWNGSKVKSSTVKNGEAGKLTPNIDRQNSLTPAPSVNQGFSTPRRGLPLGSKVRAPRSGEARMQNNQVQRLQEEWATVEHSRTMRRASEMVQHRLNPMYLLSGSNVPLQQRYRVHDNELERLRQMTETSRILQHDLKKIKYPSSVRERKKAKGKSRGLPHSDKPAASSESDMEQGALGQINQSLAPTSEPPPNTGVMHPTSPMSTPDATPRVEPETSMEQEQEGEEYEREEERETQEGEGEGELDAVENGDGGEVSEDNT